MSDNKNSALRNGGENSIIMKEGWLVKRGHVRHNWKTRWFKLSDSSLRYYKRQKDKVPQGRIPLRNAKLTIYQSDHKSDKGREFVMLLETGEEVQYPIQAPSSEEMKSWMEHIHDVIEHLQLEKEVYSPRNPFDDKNDNLGGNLSPEVLGRYVDAYGGIKRETRFFGGEQHSDGFSGLGLRVWMEHIMGLHGSDAEVTVSGLQRVGLLQLADGEASGDPFNESKYYSLLSDEESLKAMVSGKKEHDVQSASGESTNSTEDSVFSGLDSIDTTDSVVLPANLPPGEVVKRGILFKRGHIVPSWKARCFVLQRFPATLSYFDPSKKTPKVINALSLHGASVFTVGKIAAQAVLRMRQPPEHLFCVKISSGTLYIIMASSEEEREEWIDAIKPMCRKKIGGVSSSTSSG